VAPPATEAGARAETTAARATRPAPSRALSPPTPARTKPALLPQAPRRKPAIAIRKVVHAVIPPMGPGVLAAVTATRAIRRVPSHAPSRPMPAQRGTAPSPPPTSRPRPARAIPPGSPAPTVTHVPPAMSATAAACAAVILCSALAGEYATTVSADALLAPRFATESAQTSLLTPKTVDAAALPAGPATSAIAGDASAILTGPEPSWTSQIAASPPPL
jgi:hypothetical protein